MFEGFSFTSSITHYSYFFTSFHFITFIHKGFFKMSVQCMRSIWMFDVYPVTVWIIIGPYRSYRSILNCINPKWIRAIFYSIPDSTAKRSKGSNIRLKNGQKMDNMSNKKPKRVDFRTRLSFLQGSHPSLSTLHEDQIIKNFTSSIIF